MRLKHNILTLIHLITLRENHKFKQYKANNIRKYKKLEETVTYLLEPSRNQVDDKVIRK